MDMKELMVGMQISRTSFHKKITIKREKKLFYLDTYILW